MEKDVNVKNIICNDSAQTCSVRSFINTLFFSQVCNGIASTFFEDLSKNSVDILIGITNFTPLPCVMTIIIELKNGEILERVVPAAVAIPNQGTFENAISFEFKNVKRIQIRCEGNPQGNCSGLITIQKFFCVCCSDKNDKQCGCEKEHKSLDEYNKFEKQKAKYDDDDYCRCHERIKR
ncbi:MAG TPA: hypothetical protein VNR38_17355 [Ureibacillus sp.]|nr:hypothetical protein [Ureibacillus sp.]